MNRFPDNTEPTPGKSTTVRALRVLAVVIFLLFLCLGVISLLTTPVSTVNESWSGLVFSGLLCLIGGVCGCLLVGTAGMLEAALAVRDTLATANFRTIPGESEGGGAHRSVTTMPDTSRAGGMMPPEPGSVSALSDAAVVSPPSPDSPATSEMSAEIGVFDFPDGAVDQADTVVGFEDSSEVRSSTGMDTIFAPPAADGVPAAVPTQTAVPWYELIRLLEDISDNSLLSSKEREAKRLRVADEEISDAQALLHGLINEGSFARARVAAERIGKKYPQDERAISLVEQVERAREHRESDDVEQCTRQVNDLISVSAWQRARELGQQLQQGHPDSIAARQLLLRVEREYSVFQEEQRRRMHAEVQRYVTKRRWDDALVAARTFIERFPGCEDAEAVRLELPTLETNAEIEVRQRLEAKIMECVRQGRYIEAVDLARKVITRYPDSPQAEALRGQVERLEQMAHNTGMSSARVDDEQL